MQAHQFVPALLPPSVSVHRSAIRAHLADRGITTGTYFSPHLMEQPYFQRVCVAGPLPVCDDVSARMLSLPLYDVMTHREVNQVAQNLRALIEGVQPARKRRKPANREHYMPLIHGDLRKESGEAASK